MKILEILGYKIRQILTNVVDLVFFIVTVLRRGFSYLVNSKGNTLIKDSIVREIIFDGIDSLVSTVLVLSIVVGVGITAQLITFLENIGSETEVINILLHYVAFDLCPLLTAIIVICRSGSAMAIQTGIMSVNQEIKSLELLGIDALVLFAFPSLVGKTISQIALACYFSVLSISIGILSSAIFDSIANLKYFSIFSDSIEPAELVYFLIKNSIFGVIISANASFHGLHAQSSVTEVPQRTQKAIMHSFFSVFVISVLFVI